MRPRARASLLWGVVGGLSFLVLVEGYELIAALGIGIAAKIGLAVTVGVVAAGANYALEGWLARSERT